MSLKYEVVYVKKRNYIEYNRHGVSHQVDRPAMIYGKTIHWFQYGVNHRLDGPAKISKWYNAYYIRGIEYRKKQYESQVRSC